MVEALADKEVSWVDRLDRPQKRLLGIILAAVSGVLYGSNFDPPQWVMDNHPSKSQNGLDYVFSHFTGIFISSTLYFILYCCVNKNKPTVYPEAILPAFISGLMWAVAQSAWFVANGALSFSVAFPLITSGPGFIAAMWGVFVFDEIRGKRNYLILAGAFCFTVSSG